MHHLNCFVLEALANSLQKVLSNAVLSDCFSNNPDELSFDFSNFSFKCPFYKGEIFFQKETESNSKSRLFMPQFRALKGLKLNAVKPHRFERSFEFEFENDFRLIFKCHGRKSNVLLYQKDVFIDHFRKSLENDSDLEPKIFQDKKIDLNELLDSKTRVSSFPFFPLEFLEEIKSSSTVDSIQRSLDKYHDLTAFDSDETGDALIPVFSRHSVLKDLTEFTFKSIKERRFSDKKTVYLQQTEKLIADKKAFIQANRKALITLQASRNPEELGHVLMAGLHLVKPNMSSVVLPDIYNNSEVRIKLDPKLNAVANAEKYFKKAKGIPHTMRLLEQKIKAAEQVLEQQLKNLETLEQSVQFKNLKAFEKQIPENNKAENLPYKAFKFEDFDILVGKNAESNEKILNYYSAKEDLWFHAKDVAGSHVLLRTKHKGKVPERVLEAAAGLAAYYSKNRNQSLVTVTYTMRKHVRKFKGGAKGQVIVKNEETLLVKPFLPEN